MAAAQRAKSSRRRRQGALRRFLNDRRVTAAFFLAVAAAGLVPALPRVAAEAALLPARPSLERLRRGEILDATTQGEIAEALEIAHGFQPASSRIAIDTALVDLNSVRRDGVHADGGAEALTSAIQNLEAGLARGPADSFAWALLAQARLAQDGALSDSAKLALLNSYYMGPFDHGSMLVRSEVTLLNWRLLGDDVEPMARRELVELWHRSWDNQKLIIAFVCRTGSVAALSEALRRDGSARAEFDKFYEPYLSPEGCAKAP